MPHAAHAEDDFSRSLTASVRLYKTLEYEQALEQLQRARRLARSTGQNASIALHEGIILADMGRREESLVAFRSALLLDPEAQLPFKVSPKVVRDVEDVRARVRRELSQGSGQGQGTAPKSDAGVPSSPSQLPVMPVSPTSSRGSDQTRTADIMAVVMAHKPAIVTCARKQREQQPGIGGKLVMRWFIQPDGSPKEISCVSGALCSTYLAGCLTGLIQGWSFPARAAQAEAIDFPFIF